jgi:diguanylate cyclase (GGDEF)-like protein
MPKNIWPKPFHYFENVRLFLVSLLFVLVLVVTAIFAFLYNRTEHLLLQRLRAQAAAYTDLIRHTREWNSGYGGVYVEKRQGTEANIHLKKLGIDPDVAARGGKVFTIRNHAIMIKEISQRSELRDGVRFRVVGTRPLDPNNLPDELDAAAIRSFQRGETEYDRVEKVRGQAPLFRYLRPLYVEASCLECHRGQGSTPGNVLGAVSITIPMEAMSRETDRVKLFIIIAACVTIGLLVTAVYFLTWRLVISLDEAQWRLKKLASTDELTGLKNRRTTMLRLDEEFERAQREGSPLGLISIDIDHFKRINDTYGHPFGDRVLKSVAGRMEELLRSYDIIGRVGGEEFVIVAPGSGLRESVALAERVVKTIDGESVTDGTTTVMVTLSAGVTDLDATDADCEALLRRADAALYQAKHGGRNQVVAFEERGER